MKAQVFKPSPQYLHKLWLTITIIAVAMMALGFLLGWAIGRDDGPHAGQVARTVFLLVDLAWWLPAMVLAASYFRSLRYEIEDDEVIVHVGIWTKSIKHVPYRTVTNLQANRDILDRWVFNMGTLNIQTAGMSGTTGAEEKLVGLPNVQEVYDMVVVKLRRYRGGMTPTATEVEGDSMPTDGASTLTAILDEIRVIRRTLDE